LINRLADAAEGIEPLLATLTLIEEVSNRLFDQLIAAPIAATSERRLCRMRHKRRTCARLCHLASGELDQIQFLLGHVSIQTTE
jgi:integrase